MSMEQKPEGGVTVFVMGLLGLLLCPILAPVAWIMGNSYMAKCQAMSVEPEGLAVAGRILGMIGTGLVILWVVVVALFVCSGAALMGGAGA